MTFPVSFYIYAVNDLFDMDQDRKNPRKKGVWGGALAERDVGWVRNLCIAIAAVLILTSLISLNPLHVLFTVAGLAVPWLYSAPPFRLKSVPVLDSLTNMAYGFVPFAMAASLGGSFIYLDPRFLAALLVIAAVHAITTIMDYDSDRKAGQHTFAVAFGPRAPAIFAAAAFALNLLAALPYSPIASFSLGLACLLSLLLAAFPNPSNARLVLKALIAYAIVVAYFFLFKYVVFPQYLADYSEAEFSLVADACRNGSAGVPDIICSRLEGLRNASAGGG